MIVVRFADGSVEETREPLLSGHICGGPNRQASDVIRITASEEALKVIIACQLATVPLIDTVTFYGDEAKRIAGNFADCFNALQNGSAAKELEARALAIVEMVMPGITKDLEESKEEDEVPLLESQV